MKIDFNDPVVKELISELCAALPQAVKAIRFPKIGAKDIEMDTIPGLGVRIGVMCIILPLLTATLKTRKY